MLGRFLDASWSYRFGPPPDRSSPRSARRARGGRGPHRLPLPGRPAAARGVAGGPRAEAEARPDGDGALLELRSERGSSTRSASHAAGLAPDDDAFSLEPGRARLVRLRPEGDAAPGPISVRALNLRGALTAAVPA